MKNRREKKEINQLSQEAQYPTRNAERPRRKEREKKNEVCVKAPKEKEMSRTEGREFQTAESMKYPAP